MKYLLYCILLKDQAGNLDHAPEGVCDGPTYVITSNDLGAVVSAVADSELPTDTATAIAYHRVIEWFHNRCDVIPLRFGTVVGDETEIVRLLERHRTRYETLLKELAGRVEMGVRIIGVDMCPSIVPCSREVGSAPNYSGRGARYLAERKAHHDAELLASERDEQVITQYRSLFDGLFVNFKSETSRSTSHVGRCNPSFLSLYFLIPKESVEAFCNVYNKLKAKATSKILLSGPWPPYNFVLPDDY